MSEDEKGGEATLDFTTYDVIVKYIDLKGEPRSVVRHSARSTAYKAELKRLEDIGAGLLDARERACVAATAAIKRWEEMVP